MFRVGLDYPALLGELDSAPPVLTFRGDAALALRPSVAIVGARNVSAVAVQLTLLELELAGRLVRHAAGRGSLVG